MPNPTIEERRQAARKVIDILFEISNLLNTQLTHRELSLCASLIENGVNPEALATIIHELRGETREEETQYDEDVGVGVGTGLGGGSGVEDDGQMRLR
ncbi:hypothetical protein KEM52_006592 [Ascosphaera acerosa]|nr:hypothetical protein KEM52_006592 [Ascosphaera acerosa]